ncbi:type VII secretion integral membrane protein EccD [Gordonia jinhuaensis]|uniref:type VII secretion integral membrane protein EccD n=1 Tax=Gordonia jinhuaensis TaxID=1517702 RepID=UPI0016668295|nr:type VII secretion integral membrane protein EccD [Gordonia jinhuaensis]
MTTSVPGSSLSRAMSAPGATSVPVPTIGGTPSSSTASRAAEAELSRVSVLCGNTQVDVGLPSDVAIAALLPELARLLLRNEFGEARAVPDDLSSQWSLGRVGDTPFDESRTLTEVGVRDGDLLVLHTSAAGELPALYDDVIDAVAGINRREFAAWTPVAARWLGIVGLLVAAFSSVVWSVLGPWASHRIAFTVIAGVAALAFLVGAALVSSVLSDMGFAAALTTASALFGFLAGYTAIGGDDRSVGWLVGSAIVAVIALLSLRITAGHPFTHMALLTSGVLVAIGAAIQVLWQEPVAKSAAIIAVVALLVTLIAPRLTILFTRLPIPTVPSAGVNLETLEAPQHNNVNAGVSAIGALALPEATALEVRAKSANSYLSGLMLGSSVVTATAAVITAIPLHGFYWQGVVLAVLVSMALILRGRSHADLVQAATLIGVGLAGLLAVFALLAFSGGVWPVVGFGLAILIAVASGYFGVLAPRAEFSPVMRRIGEFAEYLMITATIPLAAWVLGVYGLARGL